MTQYTIIRRLSYKAESVIVVCVLKPKPFIDLLSNKRNTVISADYFIIIVIIIISSSSSSSSSSTLSLPLSSLSSSTTITIMAVDNQLKKYRMSMATKENKEKKKKKYICFISSEHNRSTQISPEFSFKIFPFLAFIFVLRQSINIIPDNIGI
uniref:Uncharacterized protein n=1 Tax=Glossina palpalis gambiensis TaxID=67801 RepID=A0A1B0BPG8_9MUSC